MTVTQAELDAAYKAAREAITTINPLYNGMIPDAMLQSIIAPSYRAGLNARLAAHVTPTKKP